MSLVFAGTIIEADVLRLDLEANGIKVFLQDETLGRIAPWYAAPGGVGAVKVLILTDALQQARPIIEEFIRTNRVAGDR